MTITPEAGREPQSANEQRKLAFVPVLFICAFWLPSCLRRYRHLLTSESIIPIALEATTSIGSANTMTHRDGKPKVMIVDFPKEERSVSSKRKNHRKASCPLRI